MPTKKLFLLVASCTLSIHALAQKPDQINIPRNNLSSFLLDQDTSKIRIAIAEKVLANLGMKATHRHQFATEFKAKTGYGQSYTAAFVVWPLEVQQRYRIEVQERQIELEPFEQYYLYGFSSKLNEGKQPDKNFSKLLLSAYQQETDSAYAHNPENFTSLKRLEKAEFRKRNWISMGYGLNYVVKDNPFAGSKKVSVGFGYLWDALHLVPIVGGPFFGETRQDKIGIPVAGIASLIIWRGVIAPILANSNLKLNNRIIESGYKVPSNLNL